MHRERSQLTLGECLFGFSVPQRRWAIAPPSRSKPNLNLAFLHQICPIKAALSELKPGAGKWTLHLAIVNKIPFEDLLEGEND